MGGGGFWLNLMMIWSSVVVVTSAAAPPHTLHVPITLLESALSKGAVCLDGSAPAYSYVKGSGNGSHSWIVYLQGGGWCYKLSDCYLRSRSFLGNSKFMNSQTDFFSLLDSNCTINPDFCNWHKVYIHYCDGSSFMSDIVNSKTNLTFRGSRIFNVMMEEMLAKGMRQANKAILSGSSAGGLATMLKCDKFRKLFPNATRVKCISDSGFFIHGKGHYGDKIREDYYANVIKTNELANSLPPTCTSKRSSNLCLFPEYFAGDIQTPLFIIESAFDLYQIAYLVLSNSTCPYNLMSCNPTELEIIRDFGKKFIKTLVGLKKSSSRGMFVHSCYVHAHFPYSSEMWTCLKLANKTIRQAVGDWYFDRSSFREIESKIELPKNCTNSFARCR